MYFQPFGLAPRGLFRVIGTALAQQLFEKGYGNYLGLARLGMFVAAETGLHLTRVSCFVGVEKMESKPKTGAELDEAVQHIVPLPHGGDDAHALIGTEICIDVEGDGASCRRPRRGCR